MQIVRRFLFVIAGIGCFALFLFTFQLSRAESAPPVTDLVEPQQTNWTETLNLPRFNPVSGTLTSVVITLSGVVSGRVGFESLDAAPAVVTLNLTATIAIQRPDGSTLFLVVPNARLIEPVPVYDGVTDYGGTSGGQRSLSATVIETYTLNSPTDLALFTGSGSVDLLATAVGSSGASGPGNVRLLRQAQAAGVVATVEYQFINPEIGLQKTVYPGHDAGVGCPGQELSLGALNAPVTYCFAITNLGDTHLDSLVFTDTDLGIALADLVLISGTTPLAPGQALVYYYNSAIAQPLLNLAEVEANPTDSDGVDIPNAPNPRASDTAEVDLAAPAIVLTKTVYLGTDGTLCPGVDLVEGLRDSPVVYCIEVVNTGNTYLDSLVITDVDLGIDVNLPTGAPILAPDQTYLFTVTSSLTADLINTASVEANPTDAQGGDLAGLPNVTDSDSAEVRLLQPAGVGDFVWLDDNVNGLQDAGEAGINDVTVRLLDGAGNFTGRTTTTANHPSTNAPGWYQFDDLFPGDYQVEFVNPNIFSFAFTSRDRSDAGPTPDARDSDADILTGRSAVFVLGEGESNLTIDAGLIVPTSLDEAPEPPVQGNVGPIFLPFVAGR